MSDLIAGLSGALDIGGKVLIYLDKCNLLPFAEWRQGRRMTRQEIDLKLEEQKRIFERKQALLDAGHQAKAKMIEAFANGEMALMDKHNEEWSREEKTQHIMFVGRAISNLRQSLIDEQYAKERIGLYAARAAVKEDQEAKATEEEPSKTWISKFMKYAGDIRDEDVMELWGKVLAGEIKQPGSFSLRTLDILSTIDQRDAQAFQRLAPYVLYTDFIPYESIAHAGLAPVQEAQLESVGLITRQMVKRIKGLPFAINKHYSMTPTSLPKNFVGTLDVNGFYLTTTGQDLYNLQTIDQSDSEKGARLFADIVGKKYGLPIAINEIKLSH